MTRRHIRSNKDNPPAAPSLEERVRALEAAIRDMQNTIGNLRVIKDTGKGLPVMPPGSGHALAIARQAAKWSNRDLAKAIGVSSAMLSLWEREKHDLPLWRREAIDSIFSAAGAELPAWPRPGEP
jgi:DNA-binding transcriptional regulator YiaG